VIATHGQRAPRIPEFHRGRPPPAGTVSAGRADLARTEGGIMLKRMVAGIAATVATATVAILGQTTTAAAGQADYSQPQVAWVQDVKSTADSATLVAKYRCWGGNEGTHLWVSLKQGGGITGQTIDQLVQEEGTSAIAAAWYDNHPPGVVCDGKWQIQQFTVYREHGIPGYHPTDWQSLVDGPAFLQFCLFDSRATDDLSSGFAYLYTFVDVKTRY
jgi:hypothetical protein